MKKIVSLLLLTVMLCSAMLFTSCGKTTEEIVVEEIEKILASENVEGHTSIVASSSIEDAGVTLSDSFKFQVNGNNTENEVYLASGSYAGNKVSVYKEGSYYYVEFLKNRVKVESDEDSDKIYGLYMSSKDIIKPIDFTKAIEYKIEEKETGDKVVTLTYQPLYFKSIYKAHIAYAFGVEEDKVEKEIPLSQCNVVIGLRADNTISSYQISYSHSKEIYHGTVKTRVSAQNLYYQYGKKAEVTITPPENYQDFDEIR